MDKSSEEQVRLHSKDEYDEMADLYSNWQANNVCMQKLHYYTTFTELKKEGVQGKTFLEFGCG